MLYQNPSQALSTKPATTKSPVEEMTDILRNLLSACHDNAAHLERQLEPVRQIGPSANGCADVTASACPLEGVLNDLINMASNLNSRLGDLRNELRI